MNNSMDLKRVGRISKALSDPYRIKIMEAVKKQQGWMQCTAIVEMFDLAQSTVSHHLKQLVEADLLHTEKDGEIFRFVSIQHLQAGRYYQEIK
jgi:ArsR family transcriptional regulator